MMRLAATVLALLLAGCGAHVSKTQYVDRVVTVDVPVAEKPITPAQLPAAPDPLGKAPPTLQQRADILLGKWCEAVGYFLRADPLLRLSAGEPPADLKAYPECRAK